MVNIISRAWKQLDHDSNLIVQNLEKKLNKESKLNEENTKTDLIHLHLNKHLNSYDPSLDPTLEPNQFISNDDYMKDIQEVSKSLYRKSLRIQKKLYHSALQFDLKLEEPAQLLEENDEILKDSLQNLGSDSESDNDDNDEDQEEEISGKLEATWGKKLEDSISSHVKFTLELITKLVSFIELDSNSSTSSNENNNSLWQDARHSYSLALKFNQSLIQQKIISIKLQNKIRELTLLCWKYQKERDEYAIQLSEVNREAISIEINQKNSLQLNELKERLNESEKIKATLEENLNELTSKLLEYDNIIKSKIDECSSSLAVESNFNQEAYENDIEKLKRQIEIQKKSLSLYEEEAIKKIKEAVNEANEEINLLRNQNNELKKVIKQSENEKNQIKSLNSTLENNKKILETYESKINSLNSRISFLEKNNQLYEQNIESLKTQLNDSSSQASNEYNKNLENELNFTKDEINQLLREIDLISNNEMSLAKSNEDLLAKLKEADHLKEGAYNENLNLQFQYEDLKKKYDRLKSQFNEYKENNEKNFQEFFANLKSNEKKNKDYYNELESNFNKLSKEYDSLLLNKKNNEQLLNKKVELFENLNTINKKSLKKVIQQYDDVIKEKKRKRNETDEELNEKKKMKKSEENNNDSASDSKKGVESSESQKMLDITLQMLRCSVCKDRFKNVMLTRCHHLFCKDCVNENLKTRLRKCPACGDKFGQDDVINIYFTN